jgi:ribosomal protein S18 acetylase RimI-like enzyme
MTLHVRNATTADLDALAPLFDDYRRFYEQPSDTELARGFLGARLSRSESVVLVAQLPDGTLAGFCQLYPSFCSVLAQPIYTLYDLFVPPAHRQQGVAKALLAAAAERGRRDGMGRLDLTTAHTNHAAQALYESMGWVQDRVFRTYNLDLAPTTATPPCA